MKIGSVFELQEPVETLRKIYRENDSDQSLALSFIRSRVSIIKGDQNQAIDAYIELLEKFSRRKENTFEEWWKSARDKSKSDREGGWVSRLPGGRWDRGFFIQHGILMDWGLPPLWVDVPSAERFCNEFGKRWLGSKSKVVRISSAVYFASAAVATGSPKRIQAAYDRLKGVSLELEKELESAIKNQQKTEWQKRHLALKVLIGSLEKCLKYGKESDPNSLAIPAVLESDLNRFRKSPAAG